MKRERIPFKKGQTIQVNTPYTLFGEAEKVVVLIPSSLHGIEDLHRKYGEEDIMVTRPDLYDNYKHISATGLLELWSRTNCRDVPIFVYEDYKFKAIPENNSDHARISLEVLD